MVESFLADSEVVSRRRFAQQDPFAGARGEAADGSAPGVEVRPPEAEPGGPEEDAARRGEEELRPVDWRAAGDRAAALAPTIDEQMPLPSEWHDADVLPKADIVVMTWTVDEWNALDYVFTNHFPHPDANGDGGERRTATGWRRKWLPYRRDFHTVVDALRLQRLAGERTPPSLNPRKMAWGFFYTVTMGVTTEYHPDGTIAGEHPARRVLLFKSELHLNQDGVRLPLAQLVERIIAEANPKLLLSTGTAGGVRPSDVLGDVVVSNSARFWLADEFGSAAVNTKKFRSKWPLPDKPPDGLIAHAEQSLLMRVEELPVEPPTVHYPPETEIKPKQDTRRPLIHLTTSPILTTDYFEFGTTTNALDQRGSCVEMDDAVIAMAAAAKGVPFGFVRNVSDPAIQAALPARLRLAWALATYYKKGLQTSYNSAIATWALIAAAIDAEQNG